MTTSKKALFSMAVFVLNIVFMAAILCLGVVASDVPQTEECTKHQRLEQTVYLVNDDYASAVDGVLVTIDNDNKNVVPYVKDSVQYFPLRFVCESFGYTVSWNDETRSVCIKSPDGVLSAINVDDAALEGKVEITHSRTMVSAEVLLEAIDCDFYSFGDGTHVIYASGIEWVPDRQAEKEALSAMQYVMMLFFRMFI